MSKFQVLVKLKEVGEFGTFVEAFKVFFAKIKEILAQGTSWQMLETSNFVVLIREEGQKLPMNFYQVRDFAYEVGLLNGKGEFQDDAEEPPSDVICRAFSNALQKALAADVERVLVMSERFKKR